MPLRYSRSSATTQITSGRAISSRRVPTHLPWFISTGWVARHKSTHSCPEGFTSTDVACIHTSSATLTVSTAAGHQIVEANASICPDFQSTLFLQESKAEVPLPVKSNHPLLHYAPLPMQLFTSLSCHPIFFTAGCHQYMCRPP